MRLSIAFALFACVGCGSKAQSVHDMGTGVGGVGMATCGNGVVEGAEQCDDGKANGTANDPCTAFCN
jgi:cysteine-rich repeat protein